MTLLLTTIARASVNCVQKRIGAAGRAFSSSSSSIEHFNSGSDSDYDASVQPPTRLPITWFTEDEEMIRYAVRQWSTQELKPIVREMDDEGCLRPNILQDLFDNGFMGMEIPEEYGGSELSFTSACLVVEEISRVDPSVAVLVDIHNTLTINALRFWGSAELQQQWLPRLATDTVSSFALSEAGAGSDAFAMKTTATPSPDGSYYTINGTKLWISNSKEAGVFLLFANINPSLGYKGITAFVVDANSEGLTVGRPERKLGLRASSTCPVVLDNVRVEASNVLGEVGQGYKYCINILNEGRIGIAAQQIGIAKGCLYDIAMPYLQERQQFGRAIGDFQGMQHQYAQIATELHAAELMTYNACRLKETNSSSFVKEASMVKLYAAQVAERTASKTIEWLGGIGFTQDLLAEKFYRDCKVGSIYEGTSNIQLQTIAKLLQAEYKQ
uniref:Short/branched chain specific acyl-CoA dehydrogenase, mitochondrial n=1 Tax=Cyclophora tenuis TaxID=216820 RepID=A0A7S1CX26_CYCTE|mmetsp:Transcript_1275/g.2327  ORF Transcript_1275/g.2327 Transcript_1275/m.2327 type:complete len:442 (+) Transcript_1275:46-1371(+)|eukprot:CAMPEP_0116556102 /NCGR_PEP_ID=MMETSP0397-20121206/8509_1 /TAXON_ID=216820 /ORGANISM="Cyclophora tenuis, Strain ECT3854" /LENGTH=441 /DNA_ID=CAMNT_0004081433 /DNA_START=12 /DNA_END=1337 /DNA_ORIENTATION=+